jgi:hypothetical protein
VRAIDTETTHAGTVSEPIPDLCITAFWDPERGSILQPAHRTDWDLVAETYQRGAVLANSPFDAYVFRKARPEIWPTILEAYDQGLVFDVNTREKMIAAATGRKVHRVNLETVCEQYGIDVSKDDPVRKRYREILGLELDQIPEAFITYAARDPYVTWEAFRMQEETAPPGCFDTLTVHAQGHLALWDQTVNGIMSDVERARALDRSISERMDMIAFYLFPRGLIYLKGKRKPVVARSQKLAQEVMRDWCKETGNEITETKKGPSLAADALRKAQIPADHDLRGYALWGSLSSLRKKNIPVFERPIVRTRYDEFKVTARTGSSNPNWPRNAADCGPDEWTGTNLQNLARPDTLVDLGFDEGEGFRECLVPRPGYKFIISDWGGAELVTLAQALLRLFGWSKLAEILQQGRDLHGEMGAKILGIDYATFDKAIKEHKQARQLAKAADFGFPGGLGYARFVDFARTQYGIVISVREAKKLKGLWKSLLPEMDLYFQWIESLRTPSGKFRVTIPGVPMTRVCGYNDACNFPFQGAAAVAAKMAGWELYKAGQDPTSPLYGSRQVLFVHDEYVTEAPGDRVEAAQREKDRIMIEAFRVVCPDVPIKVESSISSCYDK